MVIRMNYDMSDRWLVHSVPQYVLTSIFDEYITFWNQLDLAPGSVLYTHTPRSKHSFIILDQTPFFKFPLMSPPEMHLCHCQRAQLPIGYLSTIVQLLRSSPILLFTFLGHVVRSSSGISFLLRKMSRFWQRSHALLRGNVTDLVPHSGF